MKPLQERNAALCEQNGMLQVEKRLLEEDVKRWKNRTQVCCSMVLIVLFKRISEAVVMVILQGQVTSVYICAATGEPAER